MKVWKPDEQSSEVDLTPMIDIVFLLIVFFMTVANMITAEQHPIEVPISLNSSLPGEKGKRTTITVAKDGSLYSGVYPVSSDELRKRLHKEFAYDPNVQVYLRADRATEHEYINEVMQTCASLGIRKIIFAAYQSDK